MRRASACLVIWAIAATALGEVNLARNPSFETDADIHGTPDEWRWSGDSRLVTQTLALDEGRDGKRCARLTCSKYTSGNPAAHAMIMMVSSSMGFSAARGAAARSTALMITHRTNTMSAQIGKFDSVMIDVPVTLIS